MNDVTTPTESFWNKKEGKLGKWLLIITALAVGLAVTANFWALLALATMSLLHTGLAVAALVLLYAVMTSSTTQVMYRVAMYNLAGLVVTVDPIGIAKEHILEMKKSLDKMTVHLQKLQGKLQGLYHEIKENEGEIENQRKLFNQAQKRSLPSDTKVMRLASEKVGMLDQSNKTLTDMAKNVELMARRLNEMHSAAEFTIESTEAKVTIQEKTWKILKEASSAMSSAMSVYKGNPDERAIFERSMQQMADDISMKVGEMKTWTEQTEAIVNSSNLQRDILSDEGLQKLLNTDSVLLSPEQQKKITVQTQDNFGLLPDLTKSRGTNSNDYTSYLSRNKEN